MCKNMLVQLIASCCNTSGVLSTDLLQIKLLDSKEPDVCVCVCVCVCACVCVCVCVYIYIYIHTRPTMIDSKEGLAARMS